MRRLAWCFLVIAYGYPQSQPESPRFEAASIHPSNREQLAAGWSGVSSSQGRTNAVNVTLRDTIAEAYSVPEDRVLGGPPWIESDRFQIIAKAERPVGKEILDAML